MIICFIHSIKMLPPAPPSDQVVSLSPGGEDRTGQVVGPYAAGSQVTQQRDHLELHHF